MKVTELIRLLADAPNSELIAISKSGRRFNVTGVEFALEDETPVIVIRMEAQ